MTRAAPALALAIALAISLGGCETDGDEAADNRPLWPTISAPDPGGAPESAGEPANTASPPATVASPPPVVAPAEPPPAPPAKPLAMVLRNDPMVLKKALQDGEAMPVSLPREAMVRLFRTLEAFQASEAHLKVIEAYGKQLAGAEQARLRYELQSCQTARTCVVVPQR